MKNNKFCINCGKKGHIGKLCKYPKNSYGCIIFKWSESNIKYLMVQRKYSPEYTDIIRGKYYNGENILHKYLILLIQKLPLVERNYILQHDFDYLWKQIWLWTNTEKQINIFQKNYKNCEKKFNLLKNGIDELSFVSLFEKYPTTFVEPDWEFPKGRRRMGEHDQICAIRECCEETSLKFSDFTLYKFIQPFQEKFKGVDDVEYCNNYYVGLFINHNKLIYYDPSHIEQNKEIRKIGWFTEEEIIKLINPLYSHRLKLLTDVKQTITKINKIL